MAGSSGPVNRRPRAMRQPRTSPAPDLAALFGLWSPEGFRFEPRGHSPGQLRALPESLRKWPPARPAAGLAVGADDLDVMARQRAPARYDRFRPRRVLGALDHAAPQLVGAYGLLYQFLPWGMNRHGQGRFRQSVAGAKTARIKPDDR